jgi:hypothetical protein
MCGNSHVHATLRHKDLRKLNPPKLKRSQAQENDMFVSEKYRRIVYFILIHNYKKNIICMTPRQLQIFQHEFYVYIMLNVPI